MVDPDEHAWLWAWARLARRVAQTREVLSSSLPKPVSRNSEARPQTGGTPGKEAARRSSGALALRRLANGQRVVDEHAWLRAWARFARRVVRPPLAVTSVFSETASGGPLSSTRASDEPARTASTAPGERPSAQQNWRERETAHKWPRGQKLNPRFPSLPTVPESADPVLTPALKQPGAKRREAAKAVRFVDAAERRNEVACTGGGAGPDEPTPIWAAALAEAGERPRESHDAAADALCRAAGVHAPAGAYHGKCLRDVYYWVASPRSQESRDGTDAPRAWTAVRRDPTEANWAYALMESAMVARRLMELTQWAPATVQAQLHGDTAVRYDAALRAAHGPPRWMRMSAWATAGFRVTILGDAAARHAQAIDAVLCRRRWAPERAQWGFNAHDTRKFFALLDDHELFRKRQHLEGTLGLGGERTHLPVTVVEDHAQAQRALRWFNHAVRHEVRYHAARREGHFERGPSWKVVGIEPKCAACACHRTRCDVATLVGRQARVTLGLCPDARAMRATAEELARRLCEGPTECQRQQARERFRARARRHHARVQHTRRQHTAREWLCTQARRALAREWLTARAARAVRHLARERRRRRKRQRKRQQQARAWLCARASHALRQCDAREWLAQAAHTARAAHAAGGGGRALRNEDGGGAQGHGTDGRGPRRIECSDDEARHTTGERHTLDHQLGAGHRGPRMLARLGQPGLGDAQHDPLRTARGGTDGGDGWMKVPRAKAAKPRAPTLAELRRAAMFETFSRSRARQGGVAADHEITDSLAASAAARHASLDGPGRRRSGAGGRDPAHRGAPRHTSAPGDDPHESLGGADTWAPDDTTDETESAGRIGGDGDQGKQRDDGGRRRRREERRRQRQETTKAPAAVPDVLAQRRDAARAARLRDRDGFCNERYTRPPESRAQRALECPQALRALECPQAEEKEENEETGAAGAAAAAERRACVARLRAVLEQNSTAADIDFRGHHSSDGTLWCPTAADFKPQVLADLLERAGYCEAERKEGRTDGEQFLRELRESPEGICTHFAGDPTESYVAPPYKDPPDDRVPGESRRALHALLRKEWMSGAVLGPFTMAEMADVLPAGESGLWLSPTFCLPKNRANKVIFEAGRRALRAGTVTRAELPTKYPVKWRLIHHLSKGPSQDDGGVNERCDNAGDTLDAQGHRLCDYRGRHDHTTITATFESAAALRREVAAEMAEKKKKLEPGLTAGLAAAAAAAATTTAAAAAKAGLIAGQQQRQQQQQQQQRQQQNEKKEKNGEPYIAAVASDASAYYRSFGVEPKSWRLCGTRWHDLRREAPEGAADYVYLMARAPFGLATSAYTACRVSAAVKWLTLNGKTFPEHGVDEPLPTHGACGAFVDDFLTMAAAPTKASAVAKATRLQERLAQFVRAVGLTLEDTKEQRSWETDGLIEYLGYEVDLERLRAYMSQERVDSLLARLADIQAQGYVAQTELESIVGVATFVCGTAPLAKPYLRRLRKLMHRGRRHRKKKVRRGKKSHFLQLERGHHTEIAWWRAAFAPAASGFDENGALRGVNGIFIDTQDRFARHNPADGVYVSSDASFEGYGAEIALAEEDGTTTSVGHFAGAWPAEIAQAIQDAKANGLRGSAMIAWLELLVVAVLLELLAPRLAGRHQVLRVDNTVACACINRTSSPRSAALNVLMRGIALQCVRHGIRIRADWIDTKSNVWADTLSRAFSDGALLPKVWAEYEAAFAASHLSQGGTQKPHHIAEATPAEVERVILRLWRKLRRAEKKYEAAVRAAEETVTPAAPRRKGAARGVPPTRTTRVGGG